MKKFGSGNMPVAEMLEKYAASGAVRFHMPGHKGRRGFALNGNLKCDITELDFSDNLLNPHGVIALAERLFADLFRAEYAHFTTNGSTAGVLAMVAAAEDGFLVERASHTSVFNALTLLNRRAAVVNNEFNDGRFLPVTSGQVKNALEGNPQIKNVLVTYPNYYGECCDIEAVSKICREKNVRLFADSAHGAHFGTGRRLPPHAVNFCDACTVSVHKTLPAFTQSAAVLVNGKALSEKIKLKLNVFNTSSPNYALLASIDGVRYALEKSGVKCAEKAFRLISRLKKENAHLSFSDGGDFTRLAVDFSLAGLSGGQAYEALKQRNIYAEFFDDRRVVFIISVFEKESAVRKLSRALKTFEGVKGNARCEDLSFGGDYAVIDFCAASRPAEETALVKSEGRIAAENAGFYPPSVPVVLAGERITAGQIAVLNGAANTFNINNGKIKVVKE